MATRADDAGSLYLDTRARLTRAAGRIAGDGAEDVVHDAFLTYLTRAEEVVSPGAWLERVARNRALNDRRGHRTVPLVIDIADEAPPSEPERQALRELVADALGDLDRRSLTALRLRFFEDRAYDEIASTLDVRVSQAHVVVHRAVKRLGRAIVRRLAEAHDAHGCVAALEAHIGVGGDVSDHDGPCARCAPVLDELAALRGLGVLAPAAGLLHRLSIAVGARTTGASDAVGQVANVVVALGIAAASIASPSAPPAVADGAPDAVRTRSVTTDEGERRGRTGNRTPVRERAPATIDGDDTRTVADAGPVVIRGDDEHTHGEVEGVEGEPVGGVVLCEPLEPCPPPPSP